jgi:predicted enzyme related to lactoylglutathione lyase
MTINWTSVTVNDQEKALKFYTEILGFAKKVDIPAGNFRWLTVISPEGHDDVELILEPNEFPASKVYKKALFEAGIPATMFKVGDIQKEYERLKGQGVTFTKEPVLMGPVWIAVFNDTVGNLIQIVQPI